MRQVLLATTLILVPVAAFAAFTMLTNAPGVAAAALGDMAPFQTIVTDVQAIAATGDFTAAEVRITDFETAWDDAAGAMRPLDSTQWGNVDVAADAALDALRATTPTADEVTMTLASLMSELDNPALTPGGTPAATVTPTAVAGINVTDANGRALPCEDMLATLSTSLSATNLTGAGLTAVTDFQTKALERCNADDDARADGFSAQALALLGQ
jgi:hypothetical protein